MISKKALAIIVSILMAGIAMGIAAAYSTYGAPSEFGNETTTTCWVGGDPGTIYCIGNLTIGSIYPLASLTYDIGSGALRWNNIYITNISAEFGYFFSDVDVLGSITAAENITADYFFGSILNVTIVNATNATLDRLVITDGTYTTIITPTTITSDAYYAPLLQLGGDASATGDYAVAIGLNSAANGTSSVAIGSLARSYATEGMVYGSGAVAWYRAIALGYQAVAAGDYSSALGWLAYARGEGSTAIGYQVRAYGIQSLVMGSYSYAPGNYAVAIGRLANASGEYSYALGDNVTVEGNNSYGFGQDGKSTENNLMSLHNLNLIVDWNVTATWFKGLFNWTSGDTWNIFDGSTLIFNESKLETIYYNLTSAEVFVGTLDSGDVDSTKVFDEISMNVSEDNADPGFDIRFNFTNVEDFNQLILRYKTDALSDHKTSVQLYDFVSSVWGTHDYYIESQDWDNPYMPIWDSTIHIGTGANEGDVWVRIYLDDMGKLAHTHYFDFVQLSFGFGTFSSIENDPLSFHRDENINMTNKNVTDIDYLKLTNGSTTWDMYVDGNGTLVWEVE